MEQINIEEYKSYLVNKYKHECDNIETQRIKRMYLLNNKYNNEYLEKIILGTYKFIKKIIEIAENDYFGYIKIPLETEPNIKYIDLNLTGAWMSDIIVSDSDNNFYSVGLLKKIFSDFIYIEPCKIEIDDEMDEYNDFSILSEIPSYYLYIQCRKEIVEEVKKSKALKITKLW